MIITIIKITIIVVVLIIVMIIVITHGGASGLGITLGTFLLGFPSVLKDLPFMQKSKSPRSPILVRRADVPATRLRRDAKAF